MVNVLKKNEHKAKSFSIRLVLVMILCAIGLAWFGYTLGPPVGDLTRIAGFSEKEYGFRGTGHGFEKNYFTLLRYEDLLAGKGSAEIVVFGDSFSTPQDHNITWINTLYARSGMKIKLVDINSLKEIKDYFQSRSFQKNPPKVVLVEMGERTVYRRAQSLMEGADCSVPVLKSRIKFKPVTVKQTEWVQRTGFLNFDEQISWGALALRFRLFKPTKTLEVGLKDSTLFSNLRSDQLLLFNSDVIRHTKEALHPLSPSEAGVATVCAVRDMINSIKNETAVHIVVAPDKRSIYGSWIKTPLPEKVINFPQIFANKLGGYSIDLSMPLANEVERGRQDVYFPNDTHWSAEGHRIVGNVVANAIGE